MTGDARSYIAACPVCARGKSSHQAPVGILHPLPVPRCPWSHIAMDFITRQPAYKGSTVILTIVDRFSKSAHVVPLPKLPLAAETTELLVEHIFHPHGIPRDIVSDHGPQFTSQVWRGFCTALRVSVSLSSGYHQMERTNQSLESVLRCMAARHPAAWSSCLPWVEYAHNTLVSAPSGISPFMAVNGYQLPLITYQEEEAAVVRESGNRCVLLSPNLLSRHSRRRTAAGPWAPPTARHRGFGCP